MQITCLFLLHSSDSLFLCKACCLFLVNPLHFFFPLGLSSVECFGLPCSCGGSPAFTFSTGPWMVWASVCLFNTPYPHCGSHVSFILPVPLSLFLFSVPSLFTSVQFLRSNSLSFYLAHFGHFTSVSLPVGVQLPGESPKAHFLPPVHSTDTLATWRHKHRFIKVSVVLIGFGVPE